MRRAIPRRTFVAALAGAPALLASGAVALALPTKAGAQGPARRVGILYPGGAGEARSFDADYTLDEYRLAFARAMARHGWVEGRNLVLEWQFTGDDVGKNAEAAKALVAKGPHVLFTYGTPRTRALRDASNGIPIVTGANDPVGAGFTSNLTRPSSNITGLSWGVDDRARKTVEIAGTVIRGLKAMPLFLNAAYDPSGEIARPYETALRSAGIEGELVLVRDRRGYEAGLERLRGEAALFLYPVPAGLLPGLVDAAIRRKIAPLGDVGAYVDEGCLLCYYLDYSDKLGRTAYLLDKVLRGVPVSRIPFELPDRTKLSLNRRTASALGITLTPELLLRADAVVG